METNLPRKQSAVWVAMKSVKTKFSLTEEGATPVNWKVILMVFISLFSSSFTMTILFPFLPEMIKSFGYKEEEKGYYAGIVASAMFAGRAFGSYFWGWLSDRRGRRPIMLITILLNGVVSLAFGFTTDIVFAFVTRFLTGLVNGTVITAKTVLYEISDNTNQAVGMSIISVAWGIGIVAGPTVGGYLANPCKRYPDTFPPEGLFYDFPYLIPGASAFVICLLAFLLDLIWLPETRSMKDEEIEIDVISSEDVLGEASVHDKLSFHDSCSGSQSHLSIAKAAISMEDIHCESEAATFLAKTGKEIHLTRHGIEFADVIDDKSEGKHSFEGNRKETKRGQSNQSAGMLFVDKKSKSLDGCINNEYYERNVCDTGQVDTDRGSSDTNKCQYVVNNTEEDKSQDNHALAENNVNIELNNIHVNSKTELDAVESLRLLDKPKEDEKNKDTEGNDDSFNSGLGPDRGCHLCHVIRNWSIVKLLSQYDVFLVTALYAVFSASVIGMEEVFTVWCSTDTVYDGLGYEPSEIGAVMGTSSIPLLLFQFILFPNLVRRFGAKKTFLGCSIINVICISVMPTLHVINEPSLLWVLLVLLNILLKQMNSCVFSACGLFINNSVTPDLAGSVNGLSMTVTAVIRSLAPIFGGAVFAWTVSYSSDAIGPPFDVSFTFFLFGFMIWLLTVWAIMMPERLNRQKK